MDAMARPKPDWEQKSNDFNFELLSKPFSKQFIDTIKELIGEDSTSEIRLIETATMQYIINATSGSSTAGQQVESAKRLMKDSASLAKKLAHGCGGMYGQLKGAGIDTKETAKSLEAIAEKCREMLKQPQMIIPSKTIKEERIDLAKWIKFVLEEYLATKATVYMSDEYERSSLYAKVLKACLEEAKIYRPANLTQDMAETKNDPLPPLDSDYWITLSDKDIDDLINRTNELL